MLKKALLIALAVATVATAGIQAQQKALTPDDIAQIQHLYARYAMGIDSRASDGALYASVFVPDAQFINQHEAAAVGLEALTKQYGKTADGKPRPVGTSHQTWNVLIEAAPWGAVGTAYMGSGYYKDVVVKTPEGWRFKYRNYRAFFADPPAQQRGATPPAAAPPARPNSSQ